MFYLIPMAPLQFSQELTSCGMRKIEAWYDYCFSFKYNLYLPSYESFAIWVPVIIVNIKRLKLQPHIPEAKELPLATGYWFLVYGIDAIISTYDVHETTRLADAYMRRQPSMI